MIRIIFSMLFVACSLQEAYTQSTPLSNVELEARGTWLFWTYKSIV